MLIHEPMASYTRSSGLLKIGIEETCMHALEANQVLLQLGLYFNVQEVIVYNAN